MKISCMVAYVLRHPACAACRKKGRALAEYVSKDKDIAGVRCICWSAVVDEALLEHYSEYGNRLPIYQMEIYKAMGGGNC